MNVFDLTLRFNGFPIGKAKAELDRLIQLTPEQKKEHLHQKKWGIVNYHLEHNSFYQSFTKGQRFQNWSDIPVLTKRDLQRLLKERLSRGFSNRNIYINKTSGSSGDPFVFAKDKFSHALTWAIFNEWYNWFNVYHKKQARFYGIPKESSTYFKERVKDFFSNRYRFNVFDLSQKAMDSWISTFAKTKFVYITGYTTVITEFARCLLEKNIVLKDICPTLKVCFPTSEMCSNAEKHLMQTAFGVPIKNEYGAAEFGLIALENDTKWILNDLNLYIEILDDDDNILPNGEAGRIVISDLYNKAHPFIRYDIGDIGKINLVENTLVLESLIGRKEDYILLPSGKKAPGLALYYVTKSIMQDDGKVKEIKVIQTSIHNFEIHYVAINQLTNVQKEQISNALEDYLEPGVTLTFNRFEELVRTKRGKLKQFTSLLN